MPLTIPHNRENVPRENRKSARHLTFQTAMIMCDTLSFGCAILDVSEHGVCILVPIGATVPESFVLRTDHDKVLRECRLAWREGSRIGASFV
jgi:hypothetical protein